MITYLVSAVVILTFTALTWLQVQQWIATALLLTGGLAGILLLLLDEKIAFRWYQEDTSHTSDRGLITRSPLFVFAMVPLYIYILSSSTLNSGIGIGLGLAVQYVVEFIAYEYVSATQQLYSAWDTSFSEDEFRWVRVIIMSIFAIMGAVLLL